MAEQAKVLQKLVFDIEVQSEEAGSTSAAGQQFTFIYGIAPGGLSDFEIAISDLMVGETFDIPVSEINLRTYLAHLFLIFSKQTGLVELNRSMRVQFRFSETSTPAAKEIVSAMAEVQKMGSCSGSCDCGCH